MIVYLDEKKLAERFTDVPRALQQKKYEELGNYLDKILPSTDYGQGCVRVNLNGVNRETVFNYLNQAPVACVDVEPADIFTLLGGRNLASLTVTRAIQNGDCVLERIEPDQLMETLQNAAWKAQANNGTADGSSREIDPDISFLQRTIAEEDLVNNGLLTRADIDDTDEWLDGDSNRAKEAAAKEHEATVREVHQREQEALDPFAGGEF